MELMPDDEGGIECEMCGFTQTAPDIHKEDCWFCYLCGVTWNPDKEHYNEALECWETYEEEVSD